MDEYMDTILVSSRVALFGEINPQSYLAGVQAGRQLRLLAGRVEGPVEGVRRRRGIHFAFQGQGLVLEGAQQLLVVRGTDRGVYWMASE